MAIIQCIYHASDSVTNVYAQGARSILLLLEDHLKVARYLALAERSHLNFLGRVELANMEIEDAVKQRISEVSIHYSVVILLGSIVLCANVLMLCFRYQQSYLTTMLKDAFEDITKAMDLQYVI